MADLFGNINPLSLVAQRFGPGAPSTASTLVQALSGAVTQSRADQASQQLGAATTAAVSGTATDEQLGLLFQRDPAKALQVLEGAGAVSAQGREKLARTAFSIQSLQPDQQVAAIQNVAQQIQQSSGDPSAWVNMLQGNPQQIDEALRGIQIASLSVKQQQDLAVGEEELGLKKQEFGLKEQKLALDTRNTNSLISDRAERQAILRNQGTGQTPGKPTANITDFNFFQKLKKTDPEAAKQFGQSAGLIKPDGSELSVHLQKRLSESTDQAIKSESNAASFRGLAAQIGSAKISGGLFGGTWGEALKDITGTQDAKTQLRKRYNSIRGSQVVANLPPGSASDTDIQLALSGFPSDNATGAEISSFLTGLAKLEEEKGRFQSFKSSYISEKGSEKGLVNAWRTTKRIGRDLGRKDGDKITLENLTRDDISSMSEEELKAIRDQ